VVHAQPSDQLHQVQDQWEPDAVDDAYVSWRDGGESMVDCGVGNEI
jgi:hypothetical protein